MNEATSAVVPSAAAMLDARAEISRTDPDLQFTIPPVDS